MWFHLRSGTKPRSGSPQSKVSRVLYLGINADYTATKASVGTTCVDALAESSLSRAPPEKTRLHTSPR
jgi:hypothetical protein